MTVSPLRWGILGTASIARRRLIPALHASPGNDPVAIASRDLARAQQVANTSGIPRAYGSYAVLLEDPAVEAVYIPLPNHLHVPWSVRALEHGKHVLCEKPLGVDATDLRVLLAVAGRHPDLVLMEGFMYRSHPRWQQVRRMISDGAVGKLGAVHTIFTYDNRDPANIRNVVAAGGGAWLDIGCYGVSVARYLFATEPVAVTARVHVDPVFGTDRLTAAVLDFDGGIATVTCATQLAPHQAVLVHGAAGRIELDLPFNPPADRPTVIRLYRDGAAQEVVVAACDQFQLQVDAFAAAVRDGGDLPVSLADSEANMRALDRVREGGTRAG